MQFSRSRCPVEPHQDRTTAYLSIRLRPPRASQLVEQSPKNLDNQVRAQAHGPQTTATRKPLVGNQHTKWQLHQCVCPQSSCTPPETSWKKPMSCPGFHTRSLSLRVCCQLPSGHTCPRRGCWSGPSLSTMLGASTSCAKTRSCNTTLICGAAMSGCYLGYLFGSALGGDLPCHARANVCRS